MVRSAVSRALLRILWLGWLLAPPAAGAGWQEHRVWVGDGRGGWVSRPAQRQVLKHPEADHTMPFGLARMDDGKTWSALSFLFDAGRHHANLQRLSDGRLICTLVVRDDVRGGTLASHRRGCDALVSQDHGRTWDAERRYELDRFDFLRPDGYWVDGMCGHIAAVALPDGQVISAYGHYQPGAAVLVKWRPDPARPARLAGGPGPQAAAEGLPAHSASRDPDGARYREAVRTCLDNLLAHGTDRYGPVATPMLMSVIDVCTNKAPREPLALDAWVRTEERPGRRNPGGCDLWDDQPLLHALYAFSELAHDPRYARAADAYVRSFFERARKPNGMLGWGSHLFYNAFTDKVDDDRHGNPHEILVHLAEWDAMWRVDPEAVRREVEGIWRWHIVDKRTGQHNRHDDASPGCDFAFSGGSFAHAFAFLYGKTREPVWLERAKLVMNWHWSHRDPRTNLPPDAPSTGGRYDATHCFTTVVGPHAAALLRCYEITGDPAFCDTAVAYIKAWQRYAWDETAGRFFAAVKLDGTPVPEQARGPGYDAWMPTGYADTWPTTMFSYEFPLAAAQANVYAYEVTRDPELLQGARRWARHIRASLPPEVGRRWRKEILVALPGVAGTGGTYADGYGRAIAFFVHLYRASHDPADLASAKALADEAMTKLTENGWLKGHPAKPYYESTDGVGTLLCALLELNNTTGPP
jgi:hypothetical protein